METLVIDRGTSLDTLFSFVGAERIKISKSGTGVLFAATADEDEDVALAAKRARRRAAFDEIQIDLTGFKFNRDEANDYE
ncbi:hypothetical protein R80B4_00895 [Fibrobacteres bacterium R8-0-B4]